MADPLDRMSGYRLTLAQPIQASQPSGSPSFNQAWVSLQSGEKAPAPLKASCRVRPAPPALVSGPPPLKSPDQQAEAGGGCLPKPVAT